MSEKRRAHRVVVDIRVRYQSELVSLDAPVVNLSRFGMFLRSAFLDCEGARVNLDITLPGADRPLRVEGEVVRVEDTSLASGMGIRFDGVADSARRDLANFIIERSYQAPAEA